MRGKDLRCPGSLKLRGGLCFEQSARGADGWDDALEQCRSLKRRLPTVAEALLAIETFPAPVAQDNYWTSDATYRDSDDNAHSAIAIHLSGGTVDVGDSPSSSPSATSASRAPAPSSFYSSNSGISRATCSASVRRTQR